jgi:hypothetical protein
MKLSLLLVFADEHMEREVKEFGRGHTDSRGKCLFL